MGRSRDLRNVLVGIPSYGKWSIVKRDLICYYSVQFQDGGSWESTHANPTEPTGAHPEIVLISGEVLLVISYGAYGIFDDLVLFTNLKLDVIAEYWVASLVLKLFCRWRLSSQLYEGSVCGLLMKQLSRYRSVKPNLQFHPRLTENEIISCLIDSVFSLNTVVCWQNIDKCYINGSLCRLHLLYFEILSINHNMTEQK